MTQQQPQFTDKWEKEKEFYKKAVINEKGDTWPRIPTDPARENAYANWLKRVKNPVTKEFYKGRKDKYMPDGKGGEIRQTLELEPHNEVMAIIRLRTDEGDEFLLTKQNYIGYDSFGNEDRIYMPYPEVYEQPNFPYKVQMDSLTGHTRPITHGPEGNIPHYLESYTPENIDRLYAKKWAKRVHLAVKDGITSEGKTCPDLEMFKTKPFDYIKNMDYMTPQQKEAKREEFEIEQGERQPRKSR